MTITKKAHAKINLLLDVLYKRQDNFHELDGIMHTIDLHDTVSVTQISNGKKQVSVSCSELLPHNNTAYTAATSYLERTGVTDSIEINIDKFIPSQAGLGGASADAAAVLLAMQELYNALNEKALFELACQIGADVPFCLMNNSGGCARARGKGEKLESLPSLSLDLLIVKGDCGISTKELFESLKLTGENDSKDIDTAVNAIKNNDLQSLFQSTFNALEERAIDKCASIATIKSKLLEMGASVAFMTGSGSAVVGIFEDSTLLTSAKHHLKKAGYFSEIAKTI